MQEKLVQNFLQQEAGAFRINRKVTTKATPKIEKYEDYKFTENICSACNSMQVVAFCKRINCVEQQLTQIFSL